jgi:hypothetical protein
LQAWLEKQRAAEVAASAAADAVEMELQAADTAAQLADMER